MTQRDWFQLVVRGFGILLLVYGLESVYVSVHYAIGVENSNDPGMAKTLLTRGLFQLAFAAFLIRGGNLLVAFAFSTSSEKKQNSPDEL